MSSELEFERPITRTEFWNLHGQVTKRYPIYAAANHLYLKLHRCYYGAYVKMFKIKPPPSLIEGSRRAAQAGDWFFNSPYTDFHHWDAYGESLKNIPGLKKAVRTNGDSLNQAFAVCLLKEAMRQHLENELTAVSNTGDAHASESAD